MIQTKKAIANENVFLFPVNPKFFSDYYRNTDNLKMRIMSHYCDSNNPIFFYSCGQINFHNYVKMRSNDIKQIAPELLLRFNENFDKTMIDVNTMVDYLITLNPIVQIYFVDIMGNVNYVARNDCHPNYAGQCYIKRRLANVIDKSIS